MKQKGSFYILMALPAITIVFGLFGYLLIHVVYLSFRSYNPLLRINNFVGLENYIEILQDSVFLMAILRNVIYTGLAVGAGFFIAMGMALLVNMGFKGARVLRVIAITPMLLMPAAAGVIWVMLYNFDFGMINHILEFLGLSRQAFLATPKQAFYAVVITDIWGWSPFLFLIFLAGLESLPVEPLEAATIDGASVLQRFWYITLPLLKPVIVIGLLIKALDTFRAFDYMWVMTRGGPGNASQIISTIAYRSAFRIFKYGLGASMSVVSLVFSLIMTLILIKLLIARR